MDWKVSKDEGVDDESKRTSHGLRARVQMVCVLGESAEGSWRKGRHAKRLILAVDKSVWSMQ